MATLYVVATPIGNLEDITLRAIRILGEASLIAAEDTRAAKRLLTHLKIRGPRVISYTESNRRGRIPELLKALREGDVALISEAGMPAISDPGVHLVHAAAAAGYAVVPLPGASALTAAVAVSGLPSRRFHYLGFFPRKASQRRALLAEIAEMPETLVAFESPHRIQKALQDALAVLGDRRIAVCRELTKLHEETFRGTLSGAIEHFTEPRGEFTLVIEGAAKQEDQQVDSSVADEQLRELRASGMRARDAVREVAQRTGIPHRTVYGRWIALDDEPE